MNFIENESPTKLRGGYYTDTNLAQFLTKWVFEIKPRRVLEPSCGDGVFFEAMGKVQNERLEYVLGSRSSRVKQLRQKSVAALF